MTGLIELIFSIYIALMPNAMLDNHLSKNGLMVKNLIQTSNIEIEEGKIYLKNGNAEIRKEYPEFNHPLSNQPLLFIKIYDENNQNIIPIPQMFFSNQNFSMIEERILIHYYDLKIN